MGSEIEAGGLVATGFAVAMLALEEMQDGSVHFGIAGRRKWCIIAI